MPKLPKDHLKEIQEWSTPPVLVRASVIAPDAWDGRSAGIVGPFLGISGVEAFLNRLAAEGRTFAQDIYCAERAWYVDVTLLPANEP